MRKKSKAGRKRLPAQEKAVLVGFYTKQANVDKWGGMERVRNLAKTIVEGPVYALAE